MTYHDPLEERKNNTNNGIDNPAIEDEIEPDFTVISHQEELINEYAEWI